MKTKFLTALALSAFLFAVPGASCSEGEDMTPPETEEAAPILPEGEAMPDEASLPAPGVEEESEEEAPVAE